MIFSKGATYVSLFPGAVSSGGPRICTSVGVSIMLHIRLEIRAVIDCFKGGFEAGFCNAAISETPHLRRPGGLALVHRNQCAAITKKSILEEECVSGEVVLSPEVDFVCAFFEGLESVKRQSNRQTVENGVRTRRIRGSWKLKYSCRMA